MKLPQKASFGPETCEIEPKVGIWGIRRTGFPPEDSPLFYRASSLQIFHMIAAGVRGQANRPAPQRG